MNKTVVFFMRHGEVYNPNDILYGRLPGFSLSVTGRKKVELKAKDLKKENIQVIYNSPLLRTRQTADIISQALCITPIISSLLLEVRLIMQGMSLAEFRKTVQAYIYSHKYVSQGQESVGEIEERMMKFVKMILRKHYGKKILVISHGDPIVILKAYLSGVPFTFKYKKENYLNTGDFIKLTVWEGKYSWE